MKRLLAIFLVFSMIFTTICPCFADTVAKGPEYCEEVELCISLGLIEGSNGKVDDAYLSKNPTKIQALILYLKLMGLYDEASKFKGEENFKDAYTVEWAKPYLSFIKSKSELCYPGVGDEYFNPHVSIDANYYYSLMLLVLNYRLNTKDELGDFSLSDGLRYARFRGLGNIDENSFTIEKLCKATAEVLNTKPKGESGNLLQILLGQGKLSFKDDSVKKDIKLQSIVVVSNKILELTFSDDITYFSLDKSNYSIKEAESDNKLYINSLYKECDRVLVLNTSEQKSGVVYELTYRGQTFLFAGVSKNSEKPQIEGDIKCTDIDEIRVSFSTPMDRESVENIDNYIIKNNIFVVGATLDTKADPTRHTVLIKTSGMKNARRYTLTMKNLKSVDGVNGEQIVKTFIGSVDTNPPKLVTGVEVINNSRIKLKFTDEHGLDKQICENKNNYIIKSNDEKLSIDDIRGIDEDGDLYSYIDTIIIDTEPMQYNKEYKLEISNIADATSSKNKIQMPITLSFIGSYADTIKPYIGNIKVLDECRIAVDFVETNFMDIKSMTDKSNYEIDRNIKINKIYVLGNDDLDAKTAIIETNGLEDIRYQLTIKNVKDEFNNTISKTTWSITGEKEDIIPPYVKKIDWINLNTIEINFNEKIDPDEALDLKNYLIEDSKVRVIKARLNMSYDESKVTLITTTQEPNKKYTLIIDDICDIAGNKMNDKKEYFISRGDNTEDIATKIEYIVAISRHEVSVNFNKRISLVDPNNPPEITITGGHILDFSGELLNDNHTAVFVPRDDTAIADDTAIYYVEKIDGILDNTQKPFIIDPLDKPEFSGNNSDNILAEIKSIYQVDPYTIKLCFTKPIKLTEPKKDEVIGVITSDGGTKFDINIDNNSELLLVSELELPAGVTYVFDLRAPLSEGGYIRDYSGNPVANKTNWDKTEFLTYYDDEDGPKINEIEAIDNISFRVKYNEPIDKDHFGEYAIYKVNKKNSYTRIVTGDAFIDPENNCNVMVEFSNNDIYPDEKYVVKVMSPAKDLSGNIGEVDDDGYEYNPSFVMNYDYITGVLVIDSYTIEVYTKKSHQSNQNIFVYDERGVNIADSDKDNNDTISTATKIVLSSPLVENTVYKVEFKTAGLSYSFSKSATNTGSSPEFVSDIVATPASGQIEPNGTVALTTATEGAEIYYTIDGKEPNKKSIKYIEPILIDSPKTIKAVGFKDGAVSSGNFEFTYTMAPDSTAPILTVTTENPITIGDDIKARSNEAGYIYVVPALTQVTKEAFDAAVDTNNAKKAASVIGEDIKIGTTGFVAGDYKIYAIDPLSNISTAFDIRINAPLIDAPVITPYAAATVDSDFDITFTDSEAWRGAITSIKINDTELSPDDYEILPGKIVLKPSQNTLFQTVGPKTVAIEATGYNITSAIQPIAHGGAAKLVVLTQPQSPVEDRQEFIVQPVIKLLDQYDNTCTSDNTTVLSASKGDSGAWTLGGTTAATALAGIVTYTDLAPTNNQVSGEIAGAKLRFTFGEKYIESDEITLPRPVEDAPVLTAAVNATVDAAFEITFTEDATWRGAIREIKVNGMTLPSGAYDKTQEGKLILRPGMHNSMQALGTKTIEVFATGYEKAEVSQVINNGAPRSLAIITQMQSPPSGDKIFITQPLLKLVDIYGNTCETDSTTEVSATKADNGNWVLGGTTTVKADSGIITYTDLSADRNGEVLGAKITFSAYGIGDVTSDTIKLEAPTLPQAPTLSGASGATVDSDFDITFSDNPTWRSAINSVKVDGVSLTPVSGYVLSSGRITIKPASSTVLQVAGTKTITIEAGGYSMASVNQPISHGASKKIKMFSQPGNAITNGGMLSPQPKVKLYDQYDNECTTDSVTQVTASPKEGFSVGGTVNVRAINGTVSFQTLTAVCAAQKTDARLVFSGGSLTSCESNTFTIPAPVTQGNEMVTSLEPSDGAYSNIDIAEISGAVGPGTDESKALSVKIKLRQDSSGRYLTAADGLFTSSSPVELQASVTDGSFTLSLNNVSFSNGTYTIEAIAYDGQDGAKTTTKFTVDKLAPSAINISVQNTIPSNNYVTFTAINGPLSNESWKAIFDQIISNTADGANWITGVSKGALSILPSTDGVTAKLENTDMASVATINSDFVITKENVVDRAGNIAAADITINSRANAATVTNVSATNNNGSYRAGQVINLTVSFDSEVNVTGGPRIKLNTGNIEDCYALYSTGSGTNELKFTYTVKVGDNIGDLDYSSNNALELNGGTIKNKTLNMDAVLTLADPDTAGSLGANKDIVLDTIAPTGISISNQNVITGNGSVTLTASGGPLTISSWNAIIAQIKANTSGGGNWILGIPADNLTLTPAFDGVTAVLTNNNGSNAQIMKDFSISANNVYDKATNYAASDITIDSYVDTATIQSVNAGVANGSYKAGDIIPITVTFTNNVKVSGTPKFLLETGRIGAKAVYSLGSDTRTLLFEYTVQSGDNTTKLDYQGIDSLILDGGTINNATPLMSANLILPPPGAVNSLGANKTIVLDTKAPQFDPFSGVSLSSDHKKVTIAFDEAVISNVDLATLKAGITIATNGVDFNSLNALDSAAIVGGKLEISFNTALSSAMNIIKVAGNLLKDSIGNVLTTDITTNQIDASSDITPPVLDTASITGAAPDKVILTFDETLSNGSLPDKNDFTLGGDKGERTITAIALDGVNMTVTLTLSSPLTNGKAITISYTKGVNAICDIAGNAVLSIVGRTVGNTIPAASTILSVGSEKADGSYKAGETIDIVVTFSKEVDVTGTPKLVLETGSVDAEAMYTGGSGTTALTFRYTVAEGDISPDLDYKEIGSLQLNGGTIKNKDTLVDAVLSLPAKGSASSLAGAKAIVIDTKKPVLQSATIETIDANRIVLTYDEDIDPTSLELDSIENYSLGGADSGGKTITAVEISDDKVYVYLSQDLVTGNQITLSYNNVQKPIQDIAGNQSDTFTNMNIVNNVISAVKVTNITSNMLDGVYSKDYDIDILVYFNGAVDVVGSPTLTLETGAIDRSAVYKGGSGTNILTFTYRVQSGDTSADLNYVDTASLSKNGGAIYNKGTVVSADLTLPALADGNSLAGAKAIVVDTTSPAYAANPASSNILEESASVSVTIDEDGNAYYIVLYDGAMPPTSNQVRLGVDATGSALPYNRKGKVELKSGTASMLQLKELDDITNYDVYIVCEDIVGNLQSSAYKVDIATIASDNAISTFTNPNYVSAGSVTETTANIKVRFDERARAYYAVIPSGQAAPSVAQVKNGMDSSYTTLSDNMKGSIELSAGIESIIELQGLAPLTSYDIYVVAEDYAKAPNIQVAVTSVAVTTLAFDTTAPIPSGGYPKTRNNTNTTANIIVKYDEASKCYFTLLSSPSSAPTIAQIKAGLDANNNALPANRKGSVDIDASSEGTITITGLSASTSYDFYMVAEDKSQSKNTETAPHKLTVTTESEADKTAPIILSGYPKAEPFDTTMRALVKTNESGKVYYIVIPKDSLAPTSAQVKSGLNGSGGAVPSGMKGLVSVVSNTEGEILVSGLNLSTQYDIYMAAEDLASTPNLMTAPVKSSFATSGLILENVYADVAANKLYGTTVLMEYSINSTDGTNGDWTVCSDTSTNVSFIATKVYIRQKNLPSNNRLVINIESEENPPSTTGITYDVAQKKLMGTANNMQYRTGGGAWTDVTAGGITSGISFVAGAVELRNKATKYALASKAAVIGIIQAAGAPPTLTIDDFENKIIGLDSNYEYCIGQSGGPWILGSIAGDFSGTKKVYVRKKATVTILASQIQELSFTNNTDISVVGFDISALMLTGTTSAMEYSLDSTDGKTDGTWTTCINGNTTGVLFDAGPLYIRDTAQHDNYRLVVTINAAPNVGDLTYDVLTKTVTNNNATSILQYRIGGGTWKDINSSTTQNNISFAAGKVEYRYKYDETVYTSLITVAGTIAVAAPAPNVSAQVTLNNAKLIGSTTLMEYSIDGGATFSDITAAIASGTSTIDVSGTKDLRVRVKATATILPSLMTNKLN